MTERLRRSGHHPLMMILAVLLTAFRAEAKSDGDLPLFVNQSTLSVRIEGPLSTFAKERSETEYLDGKFSYTDDAGVEHVLDMKFRARGHFRRQKKTCRFPPMRLNFKKKQLDGTEFAGQNILKLVSPCNQSSKKYEQYVLKEYLAYKILQLHTPYSFRVRLLKISFVDTKYENRVTEKYGFFIEHKNQISERLDVNIADFVNTRHSKLVHEHASIAALFHYLIGNTDFSLIRGTLDGTCCHNGILVSSDSDKFIPVPYDFDFSGLVNAVYAGPNKKFRLRNVTQRLYRGHCSVNPELANTIALFQDKQEAVIDLIDQQIGMTDGTRRKARNYLLQFYGELSKSAKIEAKFSRACYD